MYVYIYISCTRPVTVRFQSLLGVDRVARTTALTMQGVAPGIINALCMNGTQVVDM